ncbi:cytochrome c-type biogenesis protein CcsB [Chitinivorax tropicus]|uniref:Cytochrome c-type biogenesis protein CcsB n=1 Tax=Chitinivorax tropicus TaxID=714531 RepID=A0A840MKI2_9PROT|nr:c-type cytochrome biogenesis protein CcsB [Chitinivorax tropicus]MBB5018015.1 cytochrome c-type biogenesis protein CcsB [Chitinivorax tropicus]
MELAHPYREPSLLARLNWFDWLYALVLIIGTGWAWTQYGNFMDGYEKGILAFSACALIAFGWYWKPIRWLLPLSGILALLATQQYGGDLNRANQAFLLKYLIASQPAIMWMCALFFLATGAYWLGLLSRSEFANKTGTGLTWSAVTMGLAGMLVRWFESYLLGPDVGHIPVSNLYEVFVLFCLITALMYLFYEARYASRQLGAFVLLVISAAVGFLLWYSFDRQAHEIQPLIPALQSWWMKLHVPANFVGYGAFAMSAMLGIAYLLATGTTQHTLRYWIAIVLLSAAGIALNVVEGAWADGAHYWGKACLTVAVLLLVQVNRGKLARFLPQPALIEEISYKAIAIGFAFFTIATVLGAMWAADAWGGYWSWDPKETWALIVWLNYAAWLHMRLMKGLRGTMLAWWAIIGLFVTTFAFLGVNMFLTGLHSYGSL